jgi:hypothetical protein
MWVAFLVDYWGEFLEMGCFLVGAFSCWRGEGRRYGWLSLSASPAPPFADDGLLCSFSCSVEPIPHALWKLKLCTRRHGADERKS